MGGVVPIGVWMLVTACELEPTLLNCTGIDEIARGFVNGMTFAGAGVALPDRTDGSGAPGREPVGDGLEGFANRAGAERTSTLVTSPASTSRGAWGITRNVVTGSCAKFGRDFRLLIGSSDAVQNDRHRAASASSVIAYACARFALVSTRPNWGGLPYHTSSTTGHNSSDR
jgi:hypothetical protein